MKKLINRPEAVVEEMIEGMVAVYPGLERLPGQAVVVRSDAAEVRDRRVALISGGGSGHEPAHAGYVGRGMLSAAVAGDVFTSPSPDAVLAAIRAVTGPPGALLIVKNYTGDRLNFGLAAEMARAEGHAVEMVIVADDVALAATAGAEHAGRRGLAGTVFVHKVAGAAAEAEASLAEVAAEAREAAAALGTMGVALSPCTIPAAGTPGFELGGDEIELGLGIHGEPGVRRGPLEPADALVDRLLDAIIDDARGRLGRGIPIALLVNNLGATPMMELAIVARRAVAGTRGAGPAPRTGVYRYVSVGAGDGGRVALDPPRRRPAAGAARRPDRSAGLAEDPRATPIALASAVVVAALAGDLLCLTRTPRPNSSPRASPYPARPGRWPRHPCGGTRPDHRRAPADRAGPGRRRR